MLRIFTGLALTVAVAACAEHRDHLSTHYLDQYAEADPRPAQFRECHGFSCAVVSRVSLRPAEWRRVRAVMTPPAKDAATERRHIAAAVALMQRLVGAQTGTSAPQWTHKNLMILPNLGDPTQLDCIDEAVNTWTYMTMMERDGLFRFHHVAPLAFAGSPVDPNPRNAAVLEDRGGGYYVLDPSLVDSGVPAPVLPLTVWLDSWPPDLARFDGAGLPRS
jgi:hypothetical protein